MNEKGWNDSENGEWKVICNVEWEDGVAIVTGRIFDSICPCDLGTRVSFDLSQF